MSYNYDKHEVVLADITDEKQQIEAYKIAGYIWFGKFNRVLIVSSHRLANLQKAGYVRSSTPISVMY